MSSPAGGAGAGISPALVEIASDEYLWRRTLAQAAKASNEALVVENIPNDSDPKEVVNKIFGRILGSKFAPHKKEGLLEVEVKLYRLFGEDLGGPYHEKLVKVCAIILEAFKKTPVQEGVTASCTFEQNSFKEVGLEGELKLAHYNREGFDFSGDPANFKKTVEQAHLKSLEMMEGSHH